MIFRAVIGCLGSSGQFRAWTWIFFRAVQGMDWDFFRAVQGMDWEFSGQFRARFVRAACGQNGTQLATGSSWAHMCLQRRFMHDKRFGIMLKLTDSFTDAPRSHCSACLHLNFLSITNFSVCIRHMIN